MFAAGAALSASAVFATGAEAAAFTVTGTGDPGGTCVAGQCTTLRAAILAANADASADTITFAPGVGGTITVATPLPISGPGGLTIAGPGAGALAVSGADASQVFNITTAAGPTNPRIGVTISGLTITHGLSSGVDGGAIESSTGSSNTPAAVLSLMGDTISDSTSTGSDGGGGIYAAGPVVISHSVISGNVASAGSGGGIDVGFATSATPKYEVTITHSQIIGNTAVSGGGIAGGNALSVSGSHITGNHAVTPSPSSGGGGGIYTIGTSLALSGTTVSGNTSTGGGGGIRAETKYGTTITNSTISGNASLAGGGLQLGARFAFPGVGAKYSPIHVLDSTISGNQAANGAGIEIPAALGSPIKIERSTISGNHGGAHSFGGGLLISRYVYDPIDVVDSTISGNTATDGGGVSLSYNGTSPLIGQTGHGSIRFENSTIASNGASQAGGGIYLGQYATGSPATKKSGVASLISTIVAGNTAAGHLQDLARATTSMGGGFNGAFSLIRKPGNANFLAKQSMITGVNPLLGPLANNGGPTKTMRPSGKSPVVDQGHATSGLTIDQRGQARTVGISGIPKPPGGDGTDIGAVELSARNVPLVFTASAHGTLIGGHRAPLLAGSATPVACAVRTGRLTSCVIELRSAKGTLLGSGESSATSARLSVRVTLTPAGSAALSHDPLGLTAAARVVGGTIGSGSQTVAGKVHLLAGPSIILPIRTQSTKLPAGLLAQLDQVAKLLKGARSITCTVSSTDGSLARSQAKAVRARLKKAGFKGKLSSAGNGHGTGGARLVITFSF